MCTTLEKGIKTRVLWNLLFSLFGISWTLQGTMKTTLLGWNGGFVGKRRKKAWQMAPLCIFWSVWKERNRLAFGDEDLSLQRLKYSFVCNLLFWVRGSLAESLSSLVSFVDWIDSQLGKVVCILPVYLEDTGFWCSLFSFNILLLLIKKKIEKDYLSFFKIFFYRPPI